MKIAIISFYSGHVERGVENWASQLSSGLERKHQIEIYAYKGKLNTAEKNSTGLARRFFLDYFSLLILKFTFNILPDLWKGNFDVIIPTNGGWQSILIRIFTWLKGNKMIIVGHSGKGWDDRFNLWCFPDIFIALTNYAKNWAKKVNPFIKIINIPNGVDIEKFSPNGKKIQIDFKKPLVLCVSALVKSKRIDLTIKAIALLEDVNLLVVGKGEEENSIRELGKTLLDKRFQLMGLSFNKMPACYRAADVFTLVSWENEAFPLVYLEAMASNLPIVATNDLVREEIIKDAGILVDPNNTQAYADSINEALKKNWGNKPRTQAEKFSWDKVYKKYDELLTNIK